MDNLGKLGVDVLTNFEGTIVSAHYYYKGTTQYGLQPAKDEKGELPKIRYFNEGRLKITKYDQG